MREVFEALEPCWNVRAGWNWVRDESKEFRLSRKGYFGIAEHFAIGDPTLS